MIGHDVMTGRSSSLMRVRHRTTPQTQLQCEIMQDSAQSEAGLKGSGWPASSAECDMPTLKWQELIKSEQSVSMMWWC